MTILIDILCCADRPESILSWLRRPSVVDLLSGISTGAIDLTHDGLSATESSPRVDHLRRILQHHGLLPERDEHLAQFETWLAAKLDAIPSPIVRAPVQQFATWHHLRRLRDSSQPGQSSAASKRSAKQEITETIKFLTWLEQAHDRNAGDCTQQDVDEYLHSGPSTRYLIRTFIVWARQSSINKSVTVRRRITQNTPAITNGQRLEWIKELLTGESESLPYRVAGILLLLYAQPLTKIAALRTTDIIDVDGETRLRLGEEPVPLPEPFASLANHHLHHRPNLRTAAKNTASPWLFPSTRAGFHLDPQMLMTRLRSLGINLRGARNTALQQLAYEVPAPLIAEMLGFSYQATQRHADLASSDWGKYAATRPRRAAQPRRVDPVQTAPESALIMTSGDGAERN